MSTEQHEESQLPSSSDEVLEAALVGLRFIVEHQDGHRHAHSLEGPYLNGDKCERCLDRQPAALTKVKRFSHAVDLHISILESIKQPEATNA